MSAKDLYKSVDWRDVSAPASRISNIIPDDAVDLEYVARAIYIGTGGNICVVTSSGDEVIFKNVPSGSILPVRASRIKATGTSAADLVMLF